MAASNKPRQARRKPQAKRTATTAAKRKSVKKSSFKNKKGVNPQPKLPASVHGFKMPDLRPWNGNQNAYSYQKLHGKSWDATSYHVLAAYGMAGEEWTSGSEKMKLRSGQLIEESTSLLAEFLVDKKSVTIFTGAAMLGARAKGAQSAIRITADENGWKVVDAKEFHYFSESDDPKQAVKRERVYNERIFPMIPSFKANGVKIVNR